MEATFTVTQEAYKEREVGVSNDRRRADYIHASVVLEQQILEGDVKFSTLDFARRRGLLFRPTEGVTLDISLLSSMVKELTALILYVRYLAKTDDWVIIGEPEMNLHPEAQVRLTELLAMLIQAGYEFLLPPIAPLSWTTWLIC
jgi:predicted ATPase